MALKQTNGHRPVVRAKTVREGLYWVVKATEISKDGRPILIPIDQRHPKPVWCVSRLKIHPSGKSTVVAVFSELPAHFSHLPDLEEAYGDYMPKPDF